MLFASSHGPHGPLILSLISILLLPPLLVALQISSTTIPPLIDVPTYSMATLNDNGSTNMNILTYATPVSVTPDRVWSLGLYKGTVSHENFVRRRSCILQLLKEEHATVVQVLGGSSGRDVDKKTECAKLGCPWEPLSSDGEPMVLPECAYYLKLTAMGDIIDCGSHEVAICKVEEIMVSDQETRNEYLSTGRLRELGLITEQGRVADK